MRWFKHGLIALAVIAFAVVECQAATKRSDLETNRNASPVVNNNPNIAGGTIKRARCTYDFDGTEAAADVIELFSIPYGSVILRDLCRVSWDSVGTTIVGDIGHALDDDEYCSAIVFNNAQVSGNITTFEEADGRGIPYTADVVGTSTNTDDIRITLDTVSGPNATGTIIVDIVYASTGS